MATFCNFLGVGGGMVGMTSCQQYSKIFQCWPTTHCRCVHIYSATLPSNVLHVAYNFHTIDHVTICLICFDIPDYQNLGWMTSTKLAGLQVCIFSTKCSPKTTTSVVSLLYVHGGQCPDEHVLFIQLK